MLKTKEPHYASHNYASLFGHLGGFLGTLGAHGGRDHSVRLQPAWLLAPWLDGSDAPFRRRTEMGSPAGRERTEQAECTGSTFLRSFTRPLSDGNPRQIGRRRRRSER